MPVRRPLTISLTPELSDMVAAEVASGLYGSASEVVRSALRLLAASRDRPSAPERPQLSPASRRGVPASHA